MEAVSRRQREQFDEAPSLAEPPHGALNHPGADGNLEATKQSHRYRGRIASLGPGLSTYYAFPVCHTVSALCGK